MPRFLVRATDQPRAHADPVLQADDALEAAILYAEGWLCEGEAGAVAVTVQDCETGHEHCFRIDLEAETAEPC